MESSAVDDCSVIKLTHILGKKWTIPIVEAVYYNRGGVHFNGLLSSIDDVTVCMLAKELNELYAEGFLRKSPVSINKTDYMNYTLTKKGLLLAELIDKAKELCLVCCPLGKSCKYAYMKRNISNKEKTKPTMIFNSSQYK